MPKTKRTVTPRQSKVRPKRARTGDLPAEKTSQAPAPPAATARDDPPAEQASQFPQVIPATADVNHVMQVPCVQGVTATSGPTERSQGTNQFFDFPVNTNTLAVQPPITNSTQLSIGYHVDNATKHKIVNGEYINLGSLLVRDPTKSQSSTLTLDAQGQLVTQPKPTSKISNVKNWTDAFLIYASIYLEAHPSRMQQLLKYMHDIRLGAEKAVGWVTYDEQYRLRKAINPSSNWGIIDSELWLVYMNPTSTAPQQSNQQSSTYYKCYDYNYRAICQRTQCPYLHRCLKCNNSHPVVHCIKAQPNANQGPGNTQRPFRANWQPKNSNQTPFQPSAARQPRPQSNSMGSGHFPNTGQFNH